MDCSCGSPFPQIRQRALVPDDVPWNTGVVLTHTHARTHTHTHTRTHAQVNKHTKQVSVSPWQLVKWQNEIHPGLCENVAGRLLRRRSVSKDPRLRRWWTIIIPRKFMSSPWTWWHHTVYSTARIRGAYKCAASKWISVEKVDVLCRR